MKPVLRLFSTFALGALLASASTLALAQNNETQPGTDRDKADASAARNLSAKDRQFLEKAAKGSMAEVELGQLAESKASSDQVKEFAAHMQKDHGQALEEIKRIAQAKGLDLPDSLDKAAQKKADMLERQTGEQFDKKYMADMVKDHQKDLKLFRDAARASKDPEVKAFAEKTAETISGHLAMAKKVAAEVKANAGKDGNQAERRTDKSHADAGTQ